MVLKARTIQKIILRRYHSSYACHPFSSVPSPYSFHPGPTLQVTSLFHFWFIFSMFLFCANEISTSLISPSFLHEGSLL